MEKKNIVIETLANKATKVYSKIKEEAINDIRKIQDAYNLSDSDIQSLLALSEAEFSSLIDKRLYYVIKIDTLIRIKLLRNSSIIALPLPKEEQINVDEMVQDFKAYKIYKSSQRLLDAIGLKSAEEIDYFTDIIVNAMQDHNIDELKTLCNGKKN